MLNWTVWNIVSIAGQLSLQQRFMFLFNTLIVETKLYYEHCRWPPDVILHIVAMLRDVSLSVDELGHIIAKTLRHFADMEQQELPPLVYQLLLLSTKVNTST